MTTFTTDDRLHAEKDGSFTIDCRLKPLTPEEIQKIDDECWVYPEGESPIFNHYKFAREIEKAHGIR